MKCAIFLLVSCGIAACSTGSPRPAARTNATTSTASSGSAARSGSPDAAPSGSTEPRIGAVKAPVFSDDGCLQDADCAPLATCHPDRCVGKANVGALARGTMCTETCLHETLDCGFNRCACVVMSSASRRCAMIAP